MRSISFFGKALAAVIVAVLTFSIAVAPAQASKATAAAGERRSVNTTLEPDDWEMASAQHFDYETTAKETQLTNRSACATVSSSFFVQTSQINRRNATLSAVSVSEWASMDPAFSPQCTEYVVTIPYDRTYLEILPNLADGAARYTVTVDGERADASVYLRLGQSRKVCLTVSSQNGIIEKTYTFDVSRTMPTELVQASFENLIPTNSMSYRELINDDGSRDRPPAADTLPSPDTYLLEVDVVNQYITVYIKDKDGKYTIPYRFMICSTGTSSTPTPIGTFKMGGYKKRFGYFRKFDCYAQYWTNLVGGIYFHSIIFKTRSDRSPSVGSYRKLGRRASHGCIRLLVPDAKWIYENCAPGTTVIVTRSKDPDPFLRELLKPAPPS